MFNRWRARWQGVKAIAIVIGLIGTIGILAVIKLLPAYPYSLENPAYVVGRPSDDQIIQSLPSVKAMDYHRLKTLLQAQQREDADRETHRLLTTLLYDQNNQQPWGFPKPSIQSLPCTDLVTIDRLWVIFSKRNFGLSVQSRIVQDDQRLPSPQAIQHQCLELPS